MRTQDTIVIGGGLAGLTAAVELARAGVAVTVLERSGGLGGRARSTVQDGTIRNLGPHALHERGPGTAILRDLGIALPGRRPPAHRTRLLVDGDLVHPLSRRAGTRPGTLAAAVRLQASARSTDPEGTVAQHLAAVAPDARDRRLLAPLIRLATYAADVEVQAADVVTEALRGGSVRYLDGGWSALVERLRVAAIRAGARIVTGAPVASVGRHRDGWSVTTSDGGRHVAADVILAAGGPAQAAEIVDDEVATPTLTAWAARAVPGRMACLDVALARRPAGPPLVLGVDAPLYLSVSSDRSRIAGDGAAVVQVARFLPLGSDAPASTRSELEALLALALPGWRDVIIHARYLPHVTVTHDGAAAAAGGRRARPGPTIPDVAGLSVAGDWVGPHGTLAQTSIVSGAVAARHIVADRARSAAPEPAGQR